MTLSGPSATSSPSHYNDDGALSDEVEGAGEEGGRGRRAHPTGGSTAARRRLQDGDGGLNCKIEGGIDV